MTHFIALLPLGLDALILPLVIFFARTIDMSLCTMRIVFLAQGRTTLAPIIGFFEALIWLLVMGKAIQNLDNPWNAIAYAGGFAAGNAVGPWVENRLAMGVRMLRIIVPGDAGEVLKTLRAMDFGVTVARGEGAQGSVSILLTLLRRRDLPRVIEIVRERHPKAFFTVEDIRQVSDGVFPVRAQESTVTGRLRGSLIAGLWSSKVSSQDAES